MPTLPLHPAVVHLPLGLALAMPLVAIGLLLAHRLGRVRRHGFGLLVGLQLVVVASGAIAMRLGERDAKRVEPIVGEAAVDAHEERAEAFLWAAGAVLAVSAAVLAVPAGAIGAVAAVAAAGTLVVAVLAIRTGEAGGAIVYGRGGAAAFTAPPGDAAASAPRVVPARREGGSHDD
jgi:uncharacterized membrane protein